jgi:SAM-dependent methyltransferase
MKNKRDSKFPATAHTRNDIANPTLLPPEALEKSEVVSNACMNRTRNLNGSNSYERDLGFAPLDFLTEKLQEQQEVAWLDLCCGAGRALIQAAEDCQTTGQSQKVKLTGIDLVPMFESIRPGLGCVRLIAAQAEKWETEERFDLITCVHGLHYIGDKLGLLEKASRWLKTGGLLTAHLDFKNLRTGCQAVSGAQFGKDLRRAGFRYAQGRRLLMRGSQTSRLVLPYRYLGADDQAGANFTGQSAVNSYYERLPS